MPKELETDFESRNTDQANICGVYLCLIFWIVNLGVYYKLEKKSILKQTWFFVEFKLDFYCLCSLQKSISKSNWFFDFQSWYFEIEKNQVTLDI